MFYLRVIMLLILTSISFVVFGETAGELAERLGSDISNFTRFILRVAFVVGIGFAVYSIYVVISGVMGSYAGKIGKGSAVMIFIGSIGLIYFTAIIDVGGQTIFGKNAKALTEIKGLK